MTQLDLDPKGRSRERLTRRQIIMIGVVVLAIIVAAGLGFFIGRMSVTPEVSEVFFAKLTEHQGEQLLVEGLSVNDINFRGEFVVPISRDTRLTWRGEPMTSDELKPGDIIAISFSGDILESYPMQLTKVSAIRKLSD